MVPRVLRLRNLSHYLQLKAMTEGRLPLRAWAASSAVTKDMDSATVPRGHLLRVSFLGKVERDILG